MMRCIAVLLRANRKISAIQYSLNGMLVLKMHLDSLRSKVLLPERLPAKARYTRRMAWYTASTTMAPTTAIATLYRFRPVTPAKPKNPASHPPTTAPTTPRSRSTTRPSPLLLTILLPMNPASTPKTIHASIDIRCAPPWGRQPVYYVSPRLNIDFRGRPADRWPMDSPLLAVLCFVLAVVLGYFFGRVSGAGTHDSRRVD